MLSETRLKEIQTFYDVYEQLVNTLDDNISYPDANFIAECRIAIPELLYTLKYIQDEHVIMLEILKNISVGKCDTPQTAAIDVLERLGYEFEISWNIKL